MRSQQTHIGTVNPALKVVCWNINGVSGKREYIKLLMDSHKPDLVFLCETKRQPVINLFSDLACDDDFRVVQIKSTPTNRGGMIAIIKTKLQLQTAEVLRMNDGDNFAQAIVLTDKRDRAFISWYNSPLMKRERFRDVLTRLHKEYDVQFFAGDFNARHPRWCTNHDNVRRGTQLIHMTRAYPEYQIHAPNGPTFTAIANKTTGALRQSTVDLVVSRATIGRLDRIRGYIAACSDHCPVLFSAEVEVDRQDQPRRIAKTLLQSTQARTEIGLCYEISLNPAGQALTQLAEPGQIAQQLQVHTCYEQAVTAIKAPWVDRAKKKRRRTGAYVNRELLKLWARKKALYDRMQWKPTERNKRDYKEACTKAQRRQRQLQREQDRRTYQRIQNDPTTEIAKALQLGIKRRNRQKALDRSTGKQMKPKVFAQYLHNNMNEEG